MVNLIRQLYTHPGKSARNHKTGACLSFNLPPGAYIDTKEIYHTLNAHYSCLLHFSAGIYNDSLTFKTLHAPILEIVCGSVMYSLEGGCIITRSIVLEDITEECSGFINELNPGRYAVENEYSGIRFVPADNVIVRTYYNPERGILYPELELSAVRITYYVITAEHKGVLYSSRKKKGGR